MEKILKVVIAFLTIFMLIIGLFYFFGGLFNFGPELESFIKYIISVAFIFVSYLADHVFNLAYGHRVLGKWS
ncbi:MAG: hypothetical protein ABIG60_02085 [Patescibacteria group bacterium]